MSTTEPAQILKRKESRRGESNWCHPLTARANGLTNSKHWFAASFLHLWRKVSESDAPSVTDSVPPRAVLSCLSWINVTFTCVVLTGACAVSPAGLTVGAKLQAGTGLRHPSFKWCSECVSVGALTFTCRNFTRFSAVMYVCLGLTSTLKNHIQSIRHGGWWMFTRMSSIIIIDRYSPLSSRLTAVLACDSTWVNSFLQRVFVFEYPPKWCTYSAGMAGATRNCCHLGAFCVHHTTMLHVTSCKATYVRCMRL